MDDDFRSALRRAVSAARSVIDEAQSLLDVESIDSSQLVPGAASKPAAVEAVPSASPAESLDADDASVSDAEAVSELPEAAEAFVSWAHAHPDWAAAEIEEWERKVATFTATLRTSGGIDADVDLYHAADPDIDWTRYGPNRIDETEFILIVMSQAWADRWAGRNKPTVGAGAVGEADALHGLFTRHQKEWQRRVKIVMFPEVEDSVIPNDLARVNRFYVDPDDLDTYDGLLRALTAQPRHVPPPLSSVPVLDRADLRTNRQTAASQTRRAKIDDETLQERLAEVESRLAKAQPGSKDALRLSSLRIAIQTLLDSQFEG